MTQDNNALAQKATRYSDTMGLTREGAIRRLRDLCGDILNQPAPPSGEVGELVEELRFLADCRQQVGYDRAGAAMEIAADILERLAGPVQQAGVDQVELLWEALKSRCCVDPVKAKRCVMVSQDDLRAALAAMQPAPGDGEG